MCTQTEADICVEINLKDGCFINQIKVKISINIPWHSISKCQKYVGLTSSKINSLRGVSLVQQSHTYPLVII